MTNCGSNVALMSEVELVESDMALMHKAWYRIGTRVTHEWHVIGTRVTRDWHAIDTLLTRE